MKCMNLRKTLIATGLASATIFGTTAPAVAQMGGSGMSPGMMGGAAGESRPDRAAQPGADTERGPGSGYGYGPGMMGGYGPGMMGGYGPGMMGGYGPGTMGGYGPGYGMGPGMMGGYGPSMMGGHGHGYGMGPGMMGGYGHGQGMLHQLNLSPEQWSKVNAIHQDVAKKNWDLAGKMHEEAYKLRNLAAAEKRDRNAITDQYKKVQEVRLQGFQARLDAQDKIDGVLTKEQKQQFRRFGSW
jgi:Spy/CpxP family protein refolding chaperone